MTTICTFNEDHSQIQFALTAEAAISGGTERNTVNSVTCAIAYSRTYVSATNTVMSMSHYSQDVREFVLETSGCEVHNINKEESGFYNLNSINNLHSHIKDRLAFYQGAATTYINRYGALFTLSYHDRRHHQSSLEEELFYCSRSRYTFTAMNV